MSYFVNGRLADSIPQAKLRQWEKERQKWLEQHGLDSIEQLDRSEDKVRHAFHATFTKQWHDWLDAGYGACVLRDSRVRELLVKRLTKSHVERYDLDAWVIMPNHFHALVTPNGGTPLGDIIQSWKGGSAREINLLLGRKGKLWQAEPFDHIVRSEAQWHHYRRYVAENPIKPRLQHDEYAVGIGKVAWASAQEMRKALEEEDSS